MDGASVDEDEGGNGNVADGAADVAAFSRGSACGGVVADDVVVDVSVIEVGVDTG